jgi:hypothetical protein
MFDEEELLAQASARILMIETPADQIPLPAPLPAAALESTEMWRPMDRDDQAERVPLGTEEDREAAAMYAIWLGGALVHMNLNESRPEQRQRPGPPTDRDDDDETDEDRK